MKSKVKTSQKSFGQILVRDLKMNKWKYIIMLPVIVYFILFAYKPMYGLLIAFQDYIPFKGMAGSKWVGFKHFDTFFHDYYFMRVLRNTVVISFLSIVFGFPAPIIFALLLNEVRNIGFKLTVNITDLFGDGVDEIRIGNRTLQNLVGASTLDECVYVNCGTIFVCLKPLLQKNVDRTIRCTVRKVNKMIEIAFYNYKGEKRSFDRMELGTMANGVAVEVRQSSEYADFDAFCQAMKPRVTDEAFTYFGRGVRKFFYENDGRTMECEYSPLSLQMRYAMADGEPIEEPKLSQGVSN